VGGREFALFRDSRANCRSESSWRPINRAPVHDAMANDIDFGMLREQRFESRVQLSLDST
jgi:hypothetical protein